MATEKEYQALYDRIAALRETVTARLGSDLIQNPQLADALTKQIDDLLSAAVAADAQAPAPPDRGLAQLAGIASRPTAGCSATGRCRSWPAPARTPTSTPCSLTS